MRCAKPWILRPATATAMSLACLAWLIVPAGTAGQVTSAGRPVDQAVGDLGPLNRSLRPMEPGIGQFDPRSRLLELDPSHQGQSIPGLTQRYIYRAPGVRAYVQRPDYLVAKGKNWVGRNVSRKAGENVIPLVPANTIFDLTPGPAAQFAPTVTSNWVDHRLDTRLGPLDAGRLYGQRINARLTPHTMAVGPLAASRARHAAAQTATPIVRSRVPQQVPIEAIFPSAASEQSHQADSHPPAVNHAR